MTPQIHPGLHIRDNVLPKKMAGKDAAKLLGLGRPALFNLLNGNADLSPELAARLEKVFGASRRELLEMHAAFDQPACRTWPAVTKPSVFLGERYQSIKA